MKNLQRFLLILLAACATQAFAEEAVMVPLPAAPVEMTGKEPMMLMHVQQTGKDADKQLSESQKPQRAIDKVHCNLFGRYRTCF